MRILRTFGALALAAVLGTGCHNTDKVDKGAFKAALDTYLSGQKTCLFADPVKFPAQADTNNVDQTKGFGALTDAGLLALTAPPQPHGKKRGRARPKPENEYDLSPKGQSAWTPDPARPGYGNFCFGSPKVTSVDKYTVIDYSGNAYTVSYQYVVDLPDWANTDAIKKAFPSVDRASTPRAGTANLAKGDAGWAVQDATAFAPMPPPLMGESERSDPPDRLVAI